MVICQMCDSDVYSTEYTYLMYLAKGSKAQSEMCRIVEKKGQATQKIFISSNGNTSGEWKPFSKLRNNLHDKHIVLLHITHGYYILQ